jgi:hypothetical protein
MLYIKINAALEVVATNEGLPQECNVWGVGLGPCPYAFSFAKEDTNFKNPILGEGWLCIRDIRSHASPKLFSQQLADSLTTFTGRKFIATDRGAGYGDDFGFVEVPVIGDDVSKCFNGDSYHVGKIVSVSKTFKKVVAEDENGNKTVFNRRGESGAWVNNNTWCMISGIRNEQNPHF